MGDVDPCGQKDSLKKLSGPKLLSSRAAGSSQTGQILKLLVDYWETSVHCLNVAASLMIETRYVARSARDIVEG